MKFKLVPEPPSDLSVVADVQRAVPLVPGSEDDCCARITQRTGIEPRDAARTWLTFLRALGLAEETTTGFARTRRDPDPEVLADAFRDRVFGADAVLDALADADGPLSAEETFERVADEVPTWERHKNPNSWQEVWRRRVERLLEWATLLGLAERVDGGYRAGRGV